MLAEESLEAPALSLERLDELDSACRHTQLHKHECKYTHTQLLSNAMYSSVFENAEQVFKCKTPAFFFFTTTTSCRMGLRHRNTFPYWQLRSSGRKKKLRIHHLVDNPCTLNLICWASSLAVASSGLCVLLGERGSRAVLVEHSQASQQKSRDLSQG